MSKLSDIADRKKTVSLEAGEVEVKGITMSTITQLIADFPGLSTMLIGKGKVDLPTAIMAIPGAITAIILAGLVEEVDEQTVKALPATYLLDLLVPIIELTFPGGVGPFLVKLEALAKTIA